MNYLITLFKRIISRVLNRKVRTLRKDTKSANKIIQQYEKVYNNASLIKVKVEKSDADVLEESK